MSTYTVVQYSIDNVLNWIDTGKIAIPEIQRPFVWSSTKVRDLIDSLYRGYPVGYLITWQTGDVRLKDGSSSHTKQILIDGQQRTTALATALGGRQIVTKDYRKTRIQVGFNPVQERFETATPVIKNNPEWIPDVATVMTASSPFALVRDYLAANPDLDAEVVEQRIGRLLAIKTQQVGVIDLAEALDIETVTEIFVRINSSGARLTPADFAMSKIASWGEDGSQLRKYVDYFCHLAVAPHAFEALKANDPQFAGSTTFKRIAWLRHDSSDLYDPKYQDVLRVAGMVGFARGRMDAVVSLLSGRDPETRQYDPELIGQSFERLRDALDRITSEHEFTQFRLILQSAGYLTSSLITSVNAVNFAYALYLRLRRKGDLSHGTLQSVVRRWFVMSMLTGRHSGSFETQWDQDLRRIDDVGVEEHLGTVERTLLSDSFWEAALPQELVSSSSRAPVFIAFLAAQNHGNARGFLSKHIRVSAMLGDSGTGDLHHLFPKAFLAQQGVVDRVDQNQVANMVELETPINIRIGKLPPHDYMARVQLQVSTGSPDLGEITDHADLTQNLAENAIPETLLTADIADYRRFLEERRQRMAFTIRDFYRSL